MAFDIDDENEVYILGIVCYYQGMKKSVQHQSNDNN